jgi:crooked neck
METEQFGIHKRKIDDFRLPRVAAVKNKQPALKQISAEQILREAQALQNETYNKPTKQIITDKQELEDYQLTKRKQFEDLVRRMRWNLRIWLKYSQWEEQQKDFRRSRSIFERSLDVDYRNVQTWLRYAEMEMRNSFINHARNIWDRATKLLPRDDQLWYKYIHMEEILGNISGARKIFDRWMASATGHQGWNTLINFEIRNGEIEYARKAYERYIHNHSEVESWIKYAKFEAKYGKESNVRAIYERSLVELGTQIRSKDLFISFAKFETKCQEYTRAYLFINIV